MYLLPVQLNSKKKSMRNKNTVVSDNLEEEIMWDLGQIPRPSYKLHVILASTVAQ